MLTINKLFGGAFVRCVVDGHRLDQHESAAAPAADRTRLVSEAARNAERLIHVIERDPHGEEDRRHAFRVVAVAVGVSVSSAPVQRHAPFVGNGDDLQGLVGEVVDEAVVRVRNLGMAKDTASRRVEDGLG